MIFSRIEDQIARIFEPGEKIVSPGQTAWFTVVAEPYPPDSSPLEFQWLKNGKAIPKATAPTYIIQEVSLADVGFYTCEISRKDGTVKVGSVELDAPGARLFVLQGANTIVSGPVQPGTGVKSCVGPYTGKITFKNASNSTWWSVPTGKTSCTISDTTRNNYSPAYTPYVEAVENITLMNWCGQNTRTFPVVAGRKYQFTTYIKNPMPPPRGQDQLGLDIVWS